MSNFFEYQDLAKVEREKISFSTDAENLQQGSDLEQLRYRVSANELASFELDAYDTSKPRRLATTEEKLGWVPDSTSDKRGLTPSADHMLEIDLKDSFTIPGISVGFINKVGRVGIEYLDADKEIVRSEGVSSTSEKPIHKFHFFNFVASGVRYIRIYISATEKPYHFYGIYRVEFGAIRFFDETNLIGAEVDTYYSSDGSTIEYDVAKIKIFHEDDVEYAFIKKQPIVYRGSNGKVLNKFFIESGESDNDYVSTLKAYDSVSNLESRFLGGKYGFSASDPYPVKKLIDDILSDTNVDYETLALDYIYISGYVPICTKRKALAMICRGANIRCLKTGGKLVFAPYSFYEDENYHDGEIVDSYSVKKNQAINKLTFVEHNYSATNEVVELYNWYLKQGANTQQIIEFSEPVWRVVPYEVVGTDSETGEDIVSDTPSTNISFLESPSKSNNICNHVKIGRLATKNKIVLKGYKIKDSENKIIARNNNSDVNSEKKELLIEDVTIIKNTLEVEEWQKQTQEVINLLFAIESTKTTQNFELVDVPMPQVGNNVSTSMVPNSNIVEILDENNNVQTVDKLPKIISVHDDLSGVYKVVAE